MAQQNAITWSAPFHGVQHLTDPRNPRRWATVSNLGTCATLACNYEGCGFRPIESRHDSVELARAAGEAFIAQAGQVAA